MFDEFDFDLPDFNADEVLEVSQVSIILCIFFVLVQTQCVGTR
jgi:hypothetical protein